MFFEDVKELKSGMNEYEYNTAMADVCVLNAIDAYQRGDGAMVCFYKNAEQEFRRRAMDGKTWTRDQMTKCMQNLNSGILKRGIKTHTGTCIY